MGSFFRHTGLPFFFGTFKIIYYNSVFFTVRKKVNFNTLLVKSSVICKKIL